VADAALADVLIHITKAINRLANESFGRSFFLSAAMGMGALWPLFFAAGWLDLRYKGEIGRASCRERV